MAATAVGAGGEARTSPQREPERGTAPPLEAEPPARKRLSYNEQRELEQLPGRIEAMEGEQAALHAAVAHPEFYKESPDRIGAALERLEDLQRLLAEAYERWEGLEERAGS